MSGDDTLGTLVGVSRRKPPPKERRLCCPMCGGDIELASSVYNCLGTGTIPPKPCGYFQTLAELAVRT